MPDPVPHSIQKIDARLSSFPADSLRFQVLTALRQFRASWLELGRLLIDVAYGGDYKEWGFDDFEVWTARELGLKKPTVRKLMVSYNYMKKYEAGRLSDAEMNEATADIPDFQTVEMLDRVRQSEDIEPEEADELHRRAFEAASPDDEKELRKEISKRLKPPRADDIETARRVEMAQLVRASRTLRRCISLTSEVPGGLRERIEQALTELEALATA